MLVCKKDRFRPASPYGAEFHQRLIVASGVETDRHVLGPVRVDEKKAPEQHSLGIECGTGRPVGADVGRDVGEPLLVLQGPPPLRSSSSSSSSSSSREQTDVGRARSIFIGLQQFRQ